MAGGGWAAVWGAVGGRPGLHLWLHVLLSLLETLSVQLEENRICELEGRRDMIDDGTSKDIHTVSGNLYLGVERMLTHCARCCRAH